MSLSRRRRSELNKGRKPLQVYVLIKEYIEIKRRERKKRRGGGKERRREEMG